MNENHLNIYSFITRAEGGSMKEPVAKKVMPLLDMDGQEMDLRAEGGFVPIGRMEKADDVLQDYQRMSLYLQQMLLEMQVRRCRQRRRSYV